MNDNQRQNGHSGSPDAASWFVQLQRRPDDSGLRCAFEAWLAADPSHAAQWAQVSGTWEHLGDLKDEPEILAAREALRAELAQAQRRPTMRWAAGIAAIAVAGAAALGIGSWRQAQPKTASSTSPPAMAEVIATYRTPVGGQQAVTLEDGSRITLSTASEVRLTEWGARRAFTVVQGEVFFEVAKNPQRPFVVSAAGRSVTALGTAFDVRVDPGQWSVSLIEGKIRVATRGTSIDLTPGRELTQIGDQPWTIENRDVARLATWREGHLMFDNRPLGSIVQEMNRYSTRKVQIADPALAAKPLSGRFKSGDVTGFVETLEAYGMARGVETSSTTIELRPLSGE